MLAVIETHPIQYHAPVYRAVQARHGIPVTVIYGSDFSVAGYHDQEFGQTFSWDTDLVSGYSARFLGMVATGGARSTETVSACGVDAVLRDLRPAVVMVVGYSPRFHRDGWLAAWRGGYPILFRGETNDDAAARSWLKQVGRDAALRALYRSCTRLLYVGWHSRRHFERLGVTPGRLVFSPYCVDASPLAADEPARVALRAATRRQFGVADDQLLVLYAGKLSARKGVDILIDAVRQLAPDLRARVVLALMGDGALHDELERRAAGQPPVPLVSLGFRNQRELSPCYHAADLLVLPSRRSETWGLVVNEALLHGLPCVVSDRVGCAPDLIVDARTGTVCAAGSAPALARAIEKASALCGLADVRQACRATVAAYSVERAAAGIAEAYASTLSRVKIA